jgi:hypothetical protein
VQILVDKTTQQILASGAFPTPPLDPNIAVVEITDTQAPRLSQAGIKTLGANNQVIVTPAPAPVPDPSIAKHAAAITSLKTAAGGTGPMATVARAILDMQGIS